MKIEEAARLLGVKEKNLRSFEEADPFNDDQVVKGYISNEATKNYGAMVITHVRGYPLPAQIIYGTPKIPYPFDGGGRYTFPPTDEIRIYDKLDGTNICAFMYTGPGKKIFVSYKTRLMPFVGNRAQGKFFSLWSKILQRYPQIPELVITSGCHLSFELYGYRNHHLILYKNPLDAALLFYIKPSTAELRPPSPERLNMNIPTPVYETRIPDPHDVVAYYRKVEEEKQVGLTEIETGFEGSEGSIWWFSVDKTSWGGWLPFKCKPADIKAVHFAVGGPSRAAIMQAVHRALDELETRLSVEDVEALLLEDFPLEKIAKRELAIKKVVERMLFEADFKEEVLLLYTDFLQNGLVPGLKVDKGQTMREMGKHYPKGDMKFVYRFIAEYEEVA